MTSLLHAREFTTVSTIIKIIIHKLHELIHRGSELSFFDISDIILVPFVNRDGFDFITNSFGKSNWEVARFKRKNSNNTIPCLFFKKKE